MSSDTISRFRNLSTRFDSVGLSVPDVSVVVPLLAIVVSEFALFTGNRSLALGGHFIVLLYCLIAPLKLEDSGNLLQVLALVPLFRLVNLGMPVFVELTIYWFPLVYGPLFPATFVIARSRPDVNIAAGWRAAARWLPIAIPASVLLGAVEYAVLEPEALVPTWDPVNLFVISVVMLLFVGLGEELIFRGILQNALEAQLQRATGLILTSVLFGLMHSGYAEPAELLFAVSVGFVFGIIYERTDSLVLVTVMHGLLNVTLFAVIPLNPELALF